MKAEVRVLFTTGHPYPGGPRLALNSNQLEAVAVWRLPCNFPR
jgi:hypothetical protein